MMLWVSRKNVERFEALLSTERDPLRREALLQRLSEAREEMERWLPGDDDAKPACRST